MRPDLGHFLADLELLFGETEHVRLRGGELRRHGDGLHGGERNRLDLLLDGLDVGGRRNAGRHGAIMHVDRTMDVEDGAGVRDFALRNAQRDDDAAVLNGLAVDGGLVLIDVGAEQAVPQARLLDVRRERGLAGLEALAVENADVGLVKAGRLQRLDGGVGVGGGVVYGNQSFESHCITPAVCLSCFPTQRRVFQSHSALG